MKSLKQLLPSFLQEGVNDPGILKAVFLAGGPGAGKSTVAKKIFNVSPQHFSTSGLKSVSSDIFFEFMLKKNNMSLDLGKLSKDDFEKVTVGPDSIRNRASVLNKTKMTNYISGRLGMIIDGTGHDAQKLITNAKKFRDTYGYDICMVFVNTSLDVAQKRNSMRDRKLPEELVKDMWFEVQDSLAEYKSFFKNNFFIIQNDGDNLDNITGDVNRDVSKMINRFVNSEIKNPVGLKWKEYQIAQNKR